MEGSTDAASEQAFQNVSGQKGKGHGKNGGGDMKAIMKTHKQDSEKMLDGDARKDSDKHITEELISFSFQHTDDRGGEKKAEIKPACRPEKLVGTGGAAGEDRQTDKPHTQINQNGKKSMFGAQKKADYIDHNRMQAQYNGRKRKRNNQKRGYA